MERIRLDVAVCRRWANGDHATAARGEDVLLAVDVAAPPDYTQRLRWPVYARWGVMTAWISTSSADASPSRSSAIDRGRSK